MKKINFIMDYDNFVKTIENEAKKPHKDLYRDNIVALLDKQRNKGIATYGQTLEHNTKMTFTERVEYLAEELVDGLMYIEHLKYEHNEMKNSLVNLVTEYITGNESERKIAIRLHDMLKEWNKGGM